MLKVECGRIVYFKKVLIGRDELVKVCIVGETDFTVSYLSIKDFDAIKDLKEFKVIKNEKGFYKPISI